MDIIQLLSDLPHIYWDYALKSAKNSTDDEDRGLSVAIKDGYMIAPGFTSGERESQTLAYSWSADHQLKTEAADSSTPSEPVPPSRDSLPRVQTFFEVLWRTLIAHSWNGQHPAPIEAGYAFIDNLMQDIKHLFYASSTTSKQQQTKNLSILKTLATCEFDGFTYVS